MAILPNLWAQWATWWRRANCGGLSDCADVFNKFVLAYTESHRSYHTLDHIEHCLTELRGWEQSTKALASSALELAVWGHDVVYAPSATSGVNEERSAAFVRRLLCDYGMTPRPGELATKTTRLIKLTATHQSEKDDDDGQLLCDIDLSILGQPTNDYAAYAVAIRAEYGFIPADVYYAARIKFLQKFLPHPFKTPHFIYKYAVSAERNLRREIERG